ncbi:MAG: hypothetical protein JW969_06670 [Spirochaetales bacterium]|nr:hypothetical protein [Spirochaetales bacterium]
MKKISIYGLFFILISVQMYGLTNTDLDRIIDFDINLKQLQKALDNGQASAVSRTRYLILDGTVSIVLPADVQAYKLERRDILNPANFVNKLKAGKTEIAQTIFSSLPPEIQADLRSLGAKAPVPEETVKNLIKALNNVLFPRKEPLSLIAGQQIKKTLLSDNTWKEILQYELDDDEISFLNRVIIDQTFTGDIAPFTIEIELIRGEWTRDQEVTSYRCRIAFTGIICFKLFVRKTITQSDTVPVNSKALIVAKPVEPVPFGNSGQIWYLKGIYLRGIK